MFSNLLRRALECCNLRGKMGYFDVDDEYTFQDNNYWTNGNNGFSNMNFSNYYSFKPNNSIRYLTNNLHRRFGTDQLSVLPKFDVNKLVNSNDVKTANFNINRDGFQIGVEFYRFIAMLSRGFMVKQVVDFGSSDIRYISISLSNNKSLIFDNFSGIILEVPLKSVIDVIQSEATGDGKPNTTDFSIRKGYEPIRTTTDRLFIVSIEICNNIKSISLCFNSKEDSSSFCENLKGLIRYNYKF
ncbi:hypothetical protein FG386_001239 [Cryptosporidium ryanae]|uniref:uncharacterized protein n=1 Tax=Cryptosporidium ryanae TaxID=515981 RepID=UPI00351A5B2E|nr:hypothetical protein FG386_001239 [Cryptosporidium ryanae]